VDVILECSYKTFGKISQVALVLWSRGIKRNLICLCYYVNVTAIDETFSALYRYHMIIGTGIYCTCGICLKQRIAL